MKTKLLKFREASWTAGVLCRFCILASFLSSTVLPIPADTVTVSMVNTRFNPPDVTINVGDTVIWRCDIGVHDTVSGSSGVASGVWSSDSQFPFDMSRGQTFSFTFTTAGTYPYYCTPHWQLGMNGVIRVLSVNSPPSVSIISPPDGGMFTAPADITLAALASDADADPVTVEFFMNGESLGVLNAPPYRLTLNGLGPGNYTFFATASDNAGGINSTSSAITVNGRQPAISTGPQSQTVNVGNDVTFTVQANGSPPLAYQWFFGPSAINGATAASLLLTNVTAAESGSYSVVVSNPFGSASASATLTVTSPPSGTPPTLTAEPQSQTVDVGSNVTFTAAAIGSAPLIWQWFFNGAPIADATNSSLQLLNVTAANAGNYFVAVANAFGSATSTNATLTVVVPQPCEFVLSKSSASFGASGGADSVTVTTRSNCAWSVENTIPWIRIVSGTNQVRPGAVSFIVSSNAVTAPRTGVFLIAGNPFTVTQDAAPLFPAKNDFNHDGQTDFLWQNIDGRVTIWLMDGTTRIGIAPLRNGRPAAPGSRIVGTLDFDVDGNVDILWQRADGSLQIWFMNATNFLRSELITSAPSLGPAWQVVGMADFDGDLHTDILLRHTEGYLKVWYMRGRQFLREALVENGKPVSKAWRVAAAADIDNKDFPEILWQNSASAIVAWFVFHQPKFGPKVLSGPMLSNLPPMDAQIVGLNDLNQDGKEDFIWRHRDGHLSVWWMNGTNRIGSFPINGAERVSPNWKFVAPRN